MSRRLILLSYTGRKTGKPYTIPVSYVEQGDALLIPGGGTFVGIPKQPDGRLDRSRLETAVKYGFMIVRWYLDEETAL